MAFFRQEYFQQVAGPVKRVWLTYGPNGASRGIATLQFANAASGAKAMEQKGTKVDGRSIRVSSPRHHHFQPLTKR
jgi:THO complex subunit 4